MNRIERLTAILLLLQAKPRTSEEIARRFEVSKRTVLRDMQALSEMGVPVIAREGAGGGYSLPDDYQLAPLALSAHETFLLLLALNALSRLSDAPFAGARVSLEAKLRALVPPGQLPQVEQLLARVSVSAPERTQRAPFLEALIAAAQEQRWVRVTYQSAAGVSTQHLLPRQVTTEHGLWYCRAHSVEHAEERTYRVDRFQSVALVEKDARPGPGAAPLPYDHPSHPEVNAVLSRRGVAAVEADPHLVGHIQRLPDGGGRLVFHCPPTELDWYTRYFAGLGPDAVVQAPPELVERLRRRAQQLAESYAER